MTEVWVAAPGHYDCLAESPPYIGSGPHWHPETHESDHRMGRPRGYTRHCLEKNCNYMERLVYA